MHEKIVRQVGYLKGLSYIEFRKGPFSKILAVPSNNNNNNNNNNKLQLGCHPVAVVILHVNEA